MKLAFSSFGTSFDAVQKYMGMASSIAKTPFRGGLPVQPMNVLKQAKSYLGMRGESLRFVVFVDARLSDTTIDSVVRLFKPENETARVLVHVLTEDMSLSDQASYDASVFVLHAPDIAQQMVSASIAQEIPTLVVVEDGLRKNAADIYGISILHVASARKEDLLASQVASWFADNLGEHRMALAADFIFMRPALAAVTVNATARQNAIIAAAFFLPGADMPVMTLNQVKMVLQLAFIYGEELTLMRIAEAVVVVVSAYASRGAVRTLTEEASRFVSLPIKCAVAYGSTLALGKGMELWLQKGPRIKALDQPIPALPGLSAPKELPPATD
ncbi:MAG: hypothetical protein FWD93_05240 [Coriobacteriia bacterium]|nr:hypothetical protein [Coriobacteriia bacterium]